MPVCASCCPCVGIRSADLRRQRHYDSPFARLMRLGFAGQPGCRLQMYPFTELKIDQQQYSYFAEAQVPVLDNLGFQLAVRREEFPRSGLGATVYKVAGKWDPFSWLAIRGSFGTNYCLLYTSPSPRDS